LRYNERSVRGSGSLSADFARRVFAYAEVRLCLRAVIEAEYALDDAVELSGNLKRPGAAAIRAFCMLIAIQLHAEGFAESFHGAREEYGTALGTLADNLETVLGGKSTNHGYILSARAVLGGELFASEMLAGAGSGGAQFIQRRKGGCRGTSAKSNGYLDALARVRRAYFARTREFGAAARY
jgi:hypothetical protein